MDMITFLVNGIFFLFVFVDSLKQKKYHYTFAAVISLLYYVFSVLQNRYELVENAVLFGWIQKIMLVILAGNLIMAFAKSNNKKKDLPAVIFACIACVFRFLRSAVFHLLTAKIQDPGADVQMIYQKYYTYYEIIDAVVKVALVLMFFCMAWQLGKPRDNNR